MHSARVHMPTKWIHFCNPDVLVSNTEGGGSGGTIHTARRDTRQGDAHHPTANLPHTIHQIV
jgi:hypothetical protein